MVYGKEVEGEKELIISVKVIPNMEEIENLHGKDLSEEEIHKIIVALAEQVTYRRIISNNMATNKRSK